MRTKNKDIAMICKGFFVKTNEYCDSISALKDYIKEYTGNAELSSESLLRHLSKAVLEFIPKEELLRVAFVQSSRIGNTEIKPRNFLEHLYLCLLSEVPMDNIGVDDYLDIWEYVESDRHNKKPWWSIDKFKENIK